MPPILATIDVEDLATPKIRAYKDALTDLITTQQQLSQGGLATGVQSSIAALGSVNAAAQTASQGLRTVGTTAAALPAQMLPFDQSIIAISEHLQSQQAKIDQYNERIRTLGASLGLLSKTSRDVNAPLAAQQSILQELYSAAQKGVPGLQQHTTALRGMLQTVDSGNRLTAEHARHLDTIAKGYALTNREAMGFGDAIKQGATRLESFSLAAAAVSAALALVAGHTVSLLRSSAELAARVETLGVVTQIVARNTHQSGTEMFVQIEAVRRLGITTQEATDAVIQFARANLQLTDASKLARVAQDLAVEAGENSSQTYARLIRAIQTQHLELLRAVGITTTIAQVTQKYAAEVGKTAKELTITERQQAVLNLILTEGAKAAGAYEAAMTTAGKQMGSFNRLVEESELALGKALLPTMSVVVTALSTMLQVWLSLPAPVQAAVTAILSAAAAMTALSAALAGAQFLGITKLVIGMTEAFQLFFLGLRTGMPVLAAASLAFGPWTLAITALIAIVGVAAAAWVAFSSATHETTEELLKNTAAAIETQESFQKLADEAVKLETAFANYRAKGLQPNAMEQERYRQVAERLLAISPRMVEVIDAESRSYRILTDEIKAATDAKRKDVDETLDAIRARTAALRQEREQVDLNLRLEQARVGRIQRGEERRFTSLGREGGGVVDELKAAQDRVASLTAKLKEVSGAATVAERALRDAMERTLPSTERQVRAQQEAQEVLSEYTKDLGTAADRADTFSRRMQILGKTNADLMKAFQSKDPVRAVQSFLAELDKSWAEYEKKQEERRKRNEKFAENFRETLDKNTDQMKIQRRILDEVLGKAMATGDNERVLQLIREQGPAILKLGSAADYAAGGFKNLAIAREKALQLADLDFFKAQTAEMEASARAFEEATREIQMKLQADSLQLNREYQRERVASEREVARAIEDADQEIYEARVVSKMKAVDQEIYQEQRRVAMIERAVEDEIRARKEATDRQREEVEARVSAAQREIALLIKRMEIQRELKRVELEAEREVATLRGDRDAVERLTNQIEIFDTITLRLKGRLEEIRRMRLAEVEASAKDQRDTLQRAEETNDKLAAAQRASLERQRESSQATIEEIRRSYDTLRNFAIGTFDSIVQAALGGFARMLEGAGSFKDVLIGIWQSIKSALFGLFESLVRQWIDSLLRMAAAQKTQQLVMAGTGMGGGLAGLGGAGIPGAGGFSIPKPILGGAVGGAAGGLVGYGVGYGTGSKPAGALSGMATGAGVGFAYGGPIGAGIGAGIGFVAGLIGAGKAQKEAEEARKAYIEAAGGIELLTKRAKEAGVSLRSFLKANDPKELTEAIEKLDKALALKEAKEGIAKTRTELFELKRAAELVGFDLRKLYNAKTIEEYNAQQRELNRLLEEQQRRLSALGVAAEGISNLTKGLIANFQREFSDVIEGMSKAEREALEKGFEKAAEAGFEGTLESFLALQYKLYKTRPEGDPELLTWLSGSTMTALDNITATIQERFTTIGMAVVSTFGNILRETGDIFQALGAISEPLDALIALQKELGLETETAFGKIIELRNAMKDNEDVVLSLTGITQVLRGLGDIGGLTQELFTRLGSDVAGLFNTLTERGVDGNTALLLMQPTLQALWQAQKDFGFAVDETTQKILNQAEEQGLVGEQFRDINERILSVLVIIAEVLGADLPESLRKFGDAGRDAGDRVRDGADRAREGLEGVRSRLDDTIAGFREMGEVAEDAGRRAEGAATGVAEGHSPTGIKQIVHRIQEANRLYREFATVFKEQSAAMERDAPRVGEAVPTPGSLRGVDRPWLNDQPSSVTIHVGEYRSEFKIEGSKATAREEWLRLKGEVERDMANNADQFASKVGKASGRYLRRPGGRKL